MKCKYLAHCVLTPKWESPQTPFFGAPQKRGQFFHPPPPHPYPPTCPPPPPPPPSGAAGGAAGGPGRRRGCGGLGGGALGVAGALSAGAGRVAAAAAALRHSRAAVRVRRADSQSGWLKGIKVREWLEKEAKGENTCLSRDACSEALGMCLFFFFSVCAAAPIICPFRIIRTSSNPFFDASPWLVGNQTEALCIEGSPILIPIVLGRLGVCHSWRQQPPFGSDLVPFWERTEWRHIKNLGFTGVATQGETRITLVRLRVRESGHFEGFLGFSKLLSRKLFTPPFRVCKDFTCTDSMGRLRKVLTQGQSTRLFWAGVHLMAGLWCPKGP